MSSAASARTKWLFLMLGGLAAGFMNGLLGAGGGILLVFVMNTIMAPQAPNNPLAVDARDIMANALAAMLPVTAFSAIRYAVLGALPTENLTRYLLPAISGGLCGAWLLERMKANVVRKIFAVIVIFSGILMIVRD